MPVTLDSLAFGTRDVQGETGDAPAGSRPRWSTGGAPGRNAAAEMNITVKCPKYHYVGYLGFFILGILVVALGRYHMYLRTNKKTQAFVGDVI